MSLQRHLKIMTPLLWVVTDEPHRVTDEVLHHTTRTVYRVDPLEGLVCYDGNKWCRVLVKDDEGVDRPVFDFQVAVHEVLAQKALMVIDHAHLSAEKMIAFYGAIVRLFLNSIRNDNVNEAPAQFVLLSCKDEIPVELAREITKIFYDLPDKEYLEKVAVKMAPVDLRSADLSKIVRAGQGLSELEFIGSCAQSLYESGSLDPKLINQIKIDTIKSGGLLEVRTPAMDMDSIGGLDNLKKIIRQAAWSWQNPQQATELGISPLRRILLVGVPGCGKSAICEATATALDLDLAKTGVSQSMNKYVGESEANMRRVFKQVKAMEPIVLWIDEFGRDLSGGASSSSVDGGTTDRVHGEFLTGLQELPESVFLVAAANRIDSLPPEMTRADRFDKIVFVGLPSFSERVEIFKIHLGDQYMAEDLTKLAAVTQFFTGAEIKALVKEVRFEIGTTEHRIPTIEEFVAQAPKMKGRVWINHNADIVNMYQRALHEWDWASSSQQDDAKLVLGNNTSSAQVTAGHKPKPKQFSPISSSSSMGDL